MAANQRNLTRPPYRGADGHGPGYYNPQMRNTVNNPQMPQHMYLAYGNPNMMGVPQDRQQQMPQMQYMPYNSAQHMMYVPQMQYMPHLPSAQGQPHSSPTPPQAPAQEQPQQQQQQQQAPPKRERKGITIKDPNTGHVIRKENLAGSTTPAAKSPGPAQPAPTATEIESRKNFQESIKAKVTPSAPTKPSIPPPSSEPSPPKPKPTPTVILKHPPPAAAASLPEDKTPEKSGIETPTQTTPSLTTTASPQPAPPKVAPAPPKFDEKPLKKSVQEQFKEQVRAAKLSESEKVETDAAPVRTRLSESDSKGESVVVIDDVKLIESEILKENISLGEEVRRLSESEKRTSESDKSEKRISESETKCVSESEKRVSESEKRVSESEKGRVTPRVSESDKGRVTPRVSESDKGRVTPRVSESDKGKTVTPRVSESDKVAVNGVKDEDTAKELSIEIPKENGSSEVTHEEADTCEDESSGSKDQFETPPATPSEHEKFVTPVSCDPPVSIVKKVDDITPTAPTPVETPAPVPVVVVPETTPVVIEPQEELEEGEIIEEAPVVTRPYRYTREELIVYRESQDTKPDLPKLECIMDTPQLKENHQRQGNRSQNSFIPSWDQQGGRNKSRGADRGNRNNNDKSQSMSNKPRVIEHVMAPQVTRKKSSNAWLSKNETGTKGKAVTASTREAQIAHMKGQVIAILNKITPQNFKDLSVKIIGLGFDDLEKLEIAVEIVFDKAVLEPAFSQTYANLCKVMSSIQFPDDPNPRVSPFRKTLLNRCQKEFLKEKSGDLEINEKIAALPASLSEAARKRELEELEYLRTKLKKKMLGNINFIGELYNLSMISAKIIMVSCIQYLLNKKTDEESIECLSKLFGTVGQKLELECSKVPTQNEMFDKNFHSFKQVSQDRDSFPARIRFMVQDVVDLRENKWVPRRVEAKPQKIDDIHREHAKQEQEKKMEAAMVQQSQRSNKGKRNDSRDDRPRGARDSRDMKKDEWQQTPQQRKIATNIDISKLQRGSESKVDVSSLQLGPGGGRSIWGRGSGTGSGANSPLSGSKEDLSTTNRFDLIKNDRKTVLCQGKTTSAPAPRGKVASERESALANVMNIGSQKRRTPSPSPVRTAPVTKSDPLTDEEIKRKTKSILTEFYSEEDLEEAVACVREELQLVKKHHVFVEAAIMMTLEQKLANNTKLGELFSVLFTENLLNADAFLSGLQQPLEIAEDVSIDVPEIYANFGRLIGKCVAKNHVTLALVKNALAPLQATRKVGVVMCEILKDALNDMDQMQLQKKWAKERMSWQALDDNYEALIEKYSLEFLSTSQEMPSGAPTTPDVFHQDMFSKLLHDKASNDELFAYIEKQIPAEERTKPAFISSLTTAVCKACLQVDIDVKDKVSLSDESMKEYSPILMKYLQSGKDNIEVEMEALNAVQLLVNDLQHPRDLAYSIFCAFDDADIVSAEGFHHWQEFGKEQQGRGVIRQALKGFFTDLAQSDGDSDNNAPN